jgi:DNA-binding CsgD family transcriptional regulator/PAS domain-containing protein
MDERGALRVVIADIERAGVDPSHWQVALGAIADLFKAQFSTLETFDQRTRRHLAFRASRLSRDTMHAYINYYSGISPRTPCLWRRPDRPILYDHLVMDESGLDRDPFYQEFLAPSDLRYFMSGLVGRTSGHQTFVTMQRSGRKGHVTPQDVASLQRLLPSLRNSSDLSGLLSGTSGQSIRAPLDWLSDAVAVLSPEETVVYANAAMENIFSLGDGIGLASGTMRFLNPADADSFARALAMIKRNRFDPLAPLHAVDLIVSRTTGTPPYSVSIRALPPTAAESLFIAADPLAIVFIRDTAPPPAIIAPSIRQAFSLTDAESRLAGALRQGVSPHDYGDAQGLSRNTVYTHLRRLKEKLGCQTTAALIRLLGSLHPPFEGPDAR